MNARLCGHLRLNVRRDGTESDRADVRVRIGASGIDDENR
jgi:hypothetical protein